MAKGLICHLQRPNEPSGVPWTPRARTPARAAPSLEDQAQGSEVTQSVSRSGLRRGAPGSTFQCHILSVFYKHPQNPLNGAMSTWA